jgi:hypothetical protein
MRWYEENPGAQTLNHAQVRGSAAAANKDPGRGRCQAERTDGGEEAFARSRCGEGVQYVGEVRDFGWVV